APARVDHEERERLAPEAHARRERLREARDAGLEQRRDVLRQDGVEAVVAQIEAERALRAREDVRERRARAQRGPGRRARRDGATLEDSGGRAVAEERGRDE